MNPPINSATNQAAMKLKSYFSGTVEAAMELARKELGEEALLINARTSTPETRYLGAYEVVFGVTSLPPTPDPRRGELSSGPSSRPTDDREPVRLTPPSLLEEVAVLKREFERMKHALLESRDADPPAPAEPPLGDRFIDPDLDPGLLRAIEQGQSLERFFKVDATLGSPGDVRAIVAFVGPPGAGKTTTLVKLAARYGLEARKPVQILTADVFRIAAAGQLRALAAILGIGCEVAETPAALAQMLEEHRFKELTFIDTPGLTGAEMEDAAELAGLIASYPVIDTHLVLPAYMRAADMNRMVHRYSIFQPKKILFTHVDETAQYGALVSQSAAWSLPMSFLAAGQQIPDDIEPASYARIAELICGHVPPVPERSVLAHPAPWAIPEESKWAAA